MEREGPQPSASYAAIRAAAVKDEITITTGGLRVIHSGSYFSIPDEDLEVKVRLSDLKFDFIFQPVVTDPVENHTLETFVVEGDVPKIVFRVINPRKMGDMFRVIPSSYLVKSERREFYAGLGIVGAHAKNAFRVDFNLLVRELSDAT